MNRLTNFERAAVLAVFAVCTLLVIGAAATRNKYVGTFVGNGAGITNIAAANLPFAPQPASANLTNWSALAITTRQPSSANLTNVSAVVGMTTNATIYTNILCFTNGVLGAVLPAS